jgi:hypothetical protein
MAKELYSFDGESVKRISRVVRRVERLRVRERQPRRRPVMPQQTTFFLLEEDIEHGQFGDAKLAGGPSMDSGLSALTRAEATEVFNPGEKVFADTLALCELISLPDADGNGGNRWAVRQCWSATRLRGKAAADIGPGATGNLNNVAGLNGALPFIANPTSTVEVYMPTEHVIAKSGLWVWAELVYQTGSSSSRWEIYSADCDGGD